MLKWVLQKSKCSGTHKLIMQICSVLRWELASLGILYRTFLQSLLFCHFIEVSLANKQISGAHFHNTSSIYCMFTTPSHGSFHLLYLLYTLFYLFLPLPFPTGNHNAVVCVYAFFMFVWFLLNSVTLSQSPLKIKKKERKSSKQHFFIDHLGFYPLFREGWQKEQCFFILEFWILEGKATLGYSIVLPWPQWGIIELIIEWMGE